MENLSEVLRNKWLEMTEQLVEQGMNFKQIAEEMGCSGQYFSHVKHGGFPSLKKFHELERVYVANKVVEPVELEIDWAKTKVEEVNVGVNSEDKRRVYSEEEIQEFLDLPEGMIDTLTRSGRIPSLELGDNLRVYPKVQIDSWLEGVC